VTRYHCLGAVTTMDGAFIAKNDKPGEEIFGAQEMQAHHQMFRFVKHFGKITKNFGKEASTFLATLNLYFLIVV